jgi:hypothetical protein
VSAHDSVDEATHVFQQVLRSTASGKVNVNATSQRRHLTVVPQSVLLEVLSGALAGDGASTLRITKAQACDLLALVDPPARRAQLAGMLLSELQDAKLLRRLASSLQSGARHVFLAELSSTLAESATQESASLADCWTATTFSAHVYFDVAVVRHVATSPMLVASRSARASARRGNMVSAAATSAEGSLSHSSALRRLLVDHLSGVGRVNVPRRRRQRQHTNGGTSNSDQDEEEEEEEEDYEEDSSSSSSSSSSWAISALLKECVGPLLLRPAVGVQACPRERTVAEAAVPDLMYAAQFAGAAMGELLELFEEEITESERGVVAHEVMAFTRDYLCALGPNTPTLSTADRHEFAAEYVAALAARTRARGRWMNSCLNAHLGHDVTTAEVKDYLRSAEMRLKEHRRYVPTRNRVVSWWRQLLWLEK